MEKYFRIGVFTTTHGIKGEIKVYPTTDDIRRFDDLKSVYFDTKEGLLKYEVDGVKYFKNIAILSFKDINKIEDIEQYKGCDILIDREDAIPLDEGEHYISDLIGLNVVDEDDKVIGTVSNVMQTGANDVYIVNNGPASEILLPSIKECIKEINIDKGYIKVHIMDGLLDL